MRKLKPRKVKVVVTFIDDPNFLELDKYYSNSLLRMRIKDSIQDSGVKNIKVKITIPTKPKGLVYGGSL